MLPGPVPLSSNSLPPTRATNIGVSHPTTLEGISKALAGYLLQGHYPAPGEIAWLKLCERSPSAGIGRLDAHREEALFCAPRNLCVEVDHVGPRYFRFLEAHTTPIWDSIGSSGTQQDTLDIP